MVAFDAEGIFCIITTKYQAREVDTSFAVSLFSILPAFFMRILTILFTILFDLVVPALHAAKISSQVLQSCISSGFLGRMDCTENLCSFEKFPALR
jgi:hypothetical protein